VQAAIDISEVPFGKAEQDCLLGGIPAIEVLTMVVCPGHDLAAWLLELGVLKSPQRSPYPLPYPGLSNSTITALKFPLVIPSGVLQAMNGPPSALSVVYAFAFSEPTSLPVLS
jgi:hypothetical protein